MKKILKCIVIFVLIILFFIFIFTIFPKMLEWGLNNTIDNLSK